MTQPLPDSPDSTSANTGKEKANPFEMVGFSSQPTTEQVAEFKRQGLDALVIAPHPDDAELGMGGTIAQLIDDGWRIAILDLTNGEPTPFGSVEKRSKETAKATAILKIKWRWNLGLRNRFVEPTLEARHQLASFFRLVRPKRIFAPFWEDAHPDHTAATSLIEAARFWSKLSNSDLLGEPYHPERIYYYYCIHLKTVPNPAFVFDISRTWLRKLESIRAYESQFITGRESLDPAPIDRFRDDAAYWGKMIGTRYGEPFTSREPLGLRDLKDLL
jgi:bacillithiol biosynthesis deacetylase BshB1